MEEYTVQILRNLGDKRNLRQEDWLYEGVMHRADGPAYTLVNQETGVVLEEDWWHKGDYHREGKPAVIERDDAGNVTLEKWYNSGKLHRLDGPAVTHFDPMTGKAVSEEYWVNNRRRSALAAKFAGPAPSP